SLTTYVMGFDVDQVAYISYAYQQGLGNNRWQNIIGVDPCQVKFPYRPHPFYAKQKLWKEIVLDRKRPHDANKPCRPTPYPNDPHGQQHQSGQQGQYGHSNPPKPEFNNSYKTPNIERSNQFHNGSDQEEN
ncbi:MAG: hypothetical protein MUF15_21480, partial [Acidobacteria bacterium]|nr:hypothetical protein [Acidobacteriota bacterium]